MSIAVCLAAIASVPGITPPVPDKSGQHIWYTPNQGQWPTEVCFKAHIPGATVYLLRDGLVFDAVSAEDMNRAHDALLQGDSTTIVHHHAWRVQFVNCQSTKPFGSETAPWYHNYLQGNDPGKWRSRVHPCRRVTYPNLWSGVDLEIYSDKGQFKYQFVVAPGADPSQIVMRYQGVTPELIEGQLVFATSVETFTDQPPVSYQWDAGRLFEVEAGFVLHGQTVKFRCGAYNRNRPLMIDPTLVAATFVGDLSDTQLLGRLATYDNEAHIYLISDPKIANLPATTGAFSTIFNGGSNDIGISKFSPDGAQLLWATYLGGSHQEQPCNALCNAQNQLVLAGTTRSADFPMAPQAFDNELDATLAPDGQEVIVVVLSEDGTQLLASTFFGSPSGDGPVGGGGLGGPNGGAHFGIELDQQGNIVIGTNTAYLTYPGTLYQVGGFAYNLFNIAVACFSPDLSQMLWCTLIGTVALDFCKDIAVLPDGTIAVAGGTASNVMPVTSGTWQTTYGGGTYDGWLAILNGSSGQILRATYFGTSGSDTFDQIEVGPDGTLWITGGSTGTLPQTDGVFSAPLSNRFIAQFSADLQNLLLCTRVGGNSEEENTVVIRAFLVDGCGYIYLSGHDNFETLESVALTEDALYTQGGFYLQVFEPGMAALHYGTLYGGNHTDGGISRYDRKGVVYQAVCSHPDANPPFQALPGAYDTTQNNTYEAAVFKMDFNSQAAVSQFSYSPQEWCAPAVVWFSNASTVGSYSWNFGDGTGWQSIEGTELAHVYEQPGSYQVQLAVYNINTCNVHDTTKAWVHIGGYGQMNLHWQVSSSDPCLNQGIITGQYTGSGADSYEWYYEGNLISTEPTVQASWYEPGNYSLWLIGHEAACNNSDTLVLTLGTGPAVELFNVEVNGPVCVGDTLVASAQSNAPTISWQWGDGSAPTNGAQAEHVYSQAGIYTITATAQSEEGCVQSASEQQETEVFALPQVELHLPDTFCIEAGTVPLTSGFPQGGIYSGAGITGNVFDPGTAGPGAHIITYTYTDAHGCTGLATQTVMVKQCVGVYEISHPIKLSVYPVPATSEIIFECISCRISSIQLMDMAGRIVAEWNAASAHRVNMPVEHLAAGVYTFWLTDDNGYQQSGLIALGQ